MVTRNFYMILAKVLLSSGTSVSKANTPVKDVNGNIVYIGQRFYSYSFPISIVPEVKIYRMDSGGIHVGSGGTLPTIDDYTLENPITSGLTASSITNTYDDDENGNPYLKMAFSLTNTTDTDIVIREIGYVVPRNRSTIKGNNENSNSTTSQLLIDRTVLDNPVTIQPSETKNIEYVLKTILPS